MLTSNKITRTWEESLEIGEIGEDVFAQYMESLNNFVVDVRYVYLSTEN